MLERNTDTDIAFQEERRRARKAIMVSKRRGKGEYMNSPTLELHEADEVSVVSASDSSSVAVLSSAEQSRLDERARKLAARKVRNRLSAEASRKRTRDEMEHLSARCECLQDQVRALQERLSKYEDVDEPEDGVSANKRSRYARVTTPPETRKRVEGIQHLKMTNKSSVCAQRRRSRSAKPTSGALMEPLDSKEHRRSPCPSVTDSEDSAGSDLTTTSTSSGTVSPHHNDDPEYQHQHHHQQQLFQFARIFDEEEERVQIAASTGPAVSLLEYDEELDAEWMDLIT